MRIIYRITLATVLALSACLNTQARKQWTIQQAQAWQKRVGVIKGFNQPEPTPGLTLDSIYQKAREIGMNSVRMWTGGRNADETVKNIRRNVEIADKYGLTLSPVLCVDARQYILSKGKDQAAIQAMKEYTQKVVGAFARDKRVVMWDVFNEPGCNNFGLNNTSDEDFIVTLDAVALIAQWAYEVNPCQAISASIFWRGDMIQNQTAMHHRAREVEIMMDVHNFHNYSCSDNSDEQGKYARMQLDYLRQMSDRPLVCTECLTRDNNSGLNRSLPIFAAYNVDFYSWGFYLCDANWTVRWGHSAYDPYDPGFHNLFRPDGEPIDWRDLDLIRNYHFTNGVIQDPGAEYTDKWDSQRAWRWMSTGPIMGRNFTSVAKAESWLRSGQTDGCNSINVSLQFVDYQRDSQKFYDQFESLLKAASAKEITVLPTLLTDADLSATDKQLTRYEVDMLRRYYSDNRIQAWDLYYHPGEQSNDAARLDTLVRRLFHNARFENPNQPIMATPYVVAKAFPNDFNYHDAFIHGNRNGWNMMEYKGGASAELCALIWRLSDLVAFSSNQTAGQTGWIKAVAYRYSRPIICTRWEPVDEANARETLQNFSTSHVFWYSAGQTQIPNRTKFRFQLVSTKR